MVFVIVSNDLAECSPHNEVAIIADRIAHDLHPMTAAVVGCNPEDAEVVAELRRRQIRAWGILPDAALADVRPELRAHCLAGAPFEPLPRQYDLIVCLGALTGLPWPDLERAIANLCAHAERVLFSPTSAGARQVAHARPCPPAEDWVELFARHDFFHEVYYDARFVAPSAMLFRKLRGSIAGVVWAYERRQRELAEQIARFEAGRFMRLMRTIHAIQRRLRPTVKRVPTGNPILAGNEDDYAAWIAANEPDSSELDRQRQHRFDYSPRISIITPVFNPPLHALREAIASVQAQTYAHWEWCLADGSTDGEVRALLEAATRQDARIRVHFLASNLGIAGNSNEALRLASGEFILLFDHDDTLAPFALHEIVSRLNEQPQLDLVYFDEDKISPDGSTRLQPMFKPTRWSPELMLSANYLMHAAIRRSLVERVDGFDPATDGAQDWDLLLRCTEQTDRIGHVAKVLYHWRMLPSSAATGVATGKPWAVDVQPRVVANHLRRIGLGDVTTKLFAPGRFQLIWPVRDETVSVIIPTRDRFELLRRCIGSLLTHTTYRNFEVLVVDTGSTDRRVLDYYAELAHQPRMRLMQFEGEFNYAAVNNLGARYATGDHLLFLNNDVEILEPDWLEEMLRWSQRREVGAVGAKLLYPEGTIQHAGIVLGLGHLFAGAPENYNASLFGGPNIYRNFLAVTSACLMTRREVFEQVRGFDEGYAIVFNDVDLCLRIANAGYRIVYTPFARLRHEEGATRANYVPHEDHVLIRQRMGADVEACDPFFNPNLDPGAQIPRLRLHRRKAYEAIREETSHG